MDPRNDVEAEDQLLVRGVSELALEFAPELFNVRSERFKRLSQFSVAEVSKFIVVVLLW